MAVDGAATLILVVAALGLLAAAGAAASHGVRQRRLALEVARRAVAARGDVLEVAAKDVSLGGDPHTLYYPTVRFTPAAVDPAGEAVPVEAECLTGVPAPPPHVGEAVELRYDPQDPTRVELAHADPGASAGQTWLRAARLLVVTAAGLALAWLLLALLVWE